MEVLLLLAFIFLIGCFVAFAAVVGVLTLFFKLIVFLFLLPFMLLGFILKSLIWVVLLPFKILGGMLRVFF